MGTNPEEHHLAPMLGLTGETFPDAVLNRSKLRDRFFVNDGASIPRLPAWFQNTSHP